MNLSFGMDLDQVISVAVPRPVDGLFTYRLPQHLISQIQIGGAVRVPFRNSFTHAFVVENPKSIHELSSEVNHSRLKNVVSVDENTPLIPPDVMALCRWAHEYYCAPLGEVLNCATPLHSAAIQKLKRSAKKVTSTVGPEVRQELLPDQLQALSVLEPLRSQGNGKVALLNGVTGSGKTEVYIELARRTLAEKKGVIVLVPEIALTPQLHQRFEEGLGQAVGLWHSAMSSGKRRDLFQALSQGDIHVVVGARSAVFAPVQNLGLIVVDEEHDSTYKQEDRVRYHARDLSVVHGKITQSFVLLGSATPSLETRERVLEGKYSLAELPKRIARGGLPEIELIDLSTEECVEETQALLARKTLEQIQQTLDAGEQVMVYLNRRGFAAFLLCRECGTVSQCPDCSISLTVHKFNPELKCHLCGHRESIPLTCSKCQGMELHPMGAGTESLETELPKFLKNTTIARLDRDLVTSTKRLEEILNQFRRGETNLLLGTQMLVKGHDFPRVTLVVVILADALFRWPDFRSPERAFQILQQVSGRAGRGERPGRVLVQTFDVDHPVLEVLTGRVSEASFLESERDLRKVLGYPPFGRLARLRMEGFEQKEVFQTIQELTHQLEATFSQEMRPPPGEERRLEILGPSEAFLEKVKGVYRWDLLLKTKEIQVLQRVVRYAKYYCAQKKKPIIVDIDPFGV